MPEVLGFRGVVASDLPFPHFVAPECFDSALAERILDWFEHEAAWKIHEVENFYQVYDLDLVATPFPSRLSIMREHSIYHEVQRALERHFNTSLSDSPHVLIQKMTSGQGINTHNDWTPNGPTHRFIVQLNRGWTTDQGGLFTLLTRLDNSPFSVLLPAHCSGLGFEISERSYHSVTPVIDGERYSIMFSYEARSPSKELFK